jgi:acyl dehydratase
MAVTELAGVDALLGAVGQHLGSSDWVTVTDDRVRAFGVATGDTAAPGNGAVAPANLILSLSNMLLPQILEVTGISAGVNYGAGEVRFPEPVAVGSRVRARADLVAADPVPGGVQTTIVITIVIEGRDGPACVIEALSRWLA